MSCGLNFKRKKFRFVCSEMRSYPGGLPSNILILFLNPIVLTETCGMQQWNKATLSSLNDKNRGRTFCALATTE